MEKTTKKIFRHVLIWKIHRPVFTTRLEDGLQLHINPIFLESEDTTPLLRPSGGGPLCWFFMLKL